MKHTPLHKSFILNGELKSNGTFIISENAGGVYEVLRVVEGTPLFLEEHLERFFFSATIAGQSIPFSRHQMVSFLDALIHHNGVATGNILISCKTHLKAFFIAHNYPAPSSYTSGVPCGLLFAERANPNAKVFQTPVRQQADEKMEKEGLYEVLLVDHLGRITEGSRSNVFFIKENQLITPPGEEVLLGITRQKTIRLAKEAGIPFGEQEIFLQDLPAFQAVFLTGTSPKILPVSQIEKWKFNPLDPLVQKLRQQYDQLIMEYIRTRRNRQY